MVQLCETIWYIWLIFGSVFEPISTFTEDKTGDGRFSSNLIKIDRIEFEKSFVNLKLIQDMLIPSKNYILLDIDERVRCSICTCERFSITNLQRILMNRGRAMYKRIHGNVSPSMQGIRNAGSNTDDVIVLQISRFTKIEASIISLLRKFNMKSHIVTILSDAKLFRELRNFILKKEMFNFIIAKPDNHPNIYSLYEVCAFCTFGKNSIAIQNIWRYGTGFQKSFKYESSFKGNFNGAHLKIGLFFKYPKYFHLDESISANREVGGGDYLLLNLIANALNFKFSAIEPVDRSLCFLKLSTNSSSSTNVINPTQDEIRPAGYCKLFLENKVQLIEFGCISCLRYQVFDVTAVFYRVEIVLISAKDAVKTQEMVLSIVLNPSILLLILSSAIFVSIFLTISNKVGKNNQQIGIMDTWIQTISMLCLEPLTVNYQKTSQRIILGVWMVSCFFVISGVFGDITSTTAKPSENKIFINTVQDMRKYDLSWITTLYVRYDDILRETVPEKVERKLKLPAKRALQYVIDNPHKYVFFYPKVMADPLIRRYFWNGISENPFHFSPSIQGNPSHPSTIVQKKDSPYRDAITRKLLRIEAAGLFIHKIIPDFGEMFSKNNMNQITDDGRENVESGFTMKNMKSVLIFISIIWMFAVFVLIIEMFSKKLEKIHMNFLSRTS